MDPSAVAELEPVRVPTMYVWPTDDAAIGRVAAESTREYVQGPYRFEVLEGVSHWVPETAPEELSDLLIRHLAST
jgi:pimeloyl-ACP methyl ester carboxylesterase